jgi:hypothetical protein
LLALRQYPERRENIQSLAWLEKSFAKIQGLGSYAMAQICLAAYGRRGTEDAASAGDLQAKNEFLRNIPVAAWITLAASNPQNWLGPGEHS